MKKILIIVSIIAAIGVIVGLLCFFLVFSDSKISNKEANRIIDDVISEKIFTEEGSTEDMEHIVNNASVIVDSITHTDEKTAIASCTVNSLNVYDPLSQMITDLKGKEMTYEQLLQEINNRIKTAEKTESKIDITFNKIDSEWIPSLDYEAYNTYLGGYLDYCTEAMNVELEDE